MGKDVIIACDFDSKEKLFSFLDQFKDVKPYLKIGMELYYAEGPAIVEEAKKRGHKVFLDLKLHDIPNTVKKSMTVISKMGVDMVNVHVAGTSNMMRAALEGLSGTNTMLIGVTQLTSTDEETMKKDILIDKPLDEVVMSYAKLAKDCGLNGVVCSPLEAGKVHEVCGNDFLTITPGIRFEDNDKGDQKRVTTPTKAKYLGSDFIVVGRSITGAADPVAAYNRCVEEFVG